MDMVVFCAVKHSKNYVETQEKFEQTFALAYISRFILAYGLKEILEKAPSPIILSVCAPGMKGKIDWDDLQHKKHFQPQNVMYHGSRLNDLLGVAFAQNDTIGRIKYILYNPWAVTTSGMMETFDSKIMKLVFRIIGKPAEKAVEPLVELLENPPASSLSAYKERKKISLAMDTFNEENAQKLYKTTMGLLKTGRD